MSFYSAHDKIRKPTMSASGLRLHGTNRAGRASLMKGQWFVNGQILIINSWQAK